MTVWLVVRIVATFGWACIAYKIVEKFWRHDWFLTIAAIAAISGYSVFSWAKFLEELGK